MNGGAQSVRVAIPSLPPADFLLRPLDGAAEAATSAGRQGMATALLARLVTGPAGEATDVRALPVAVHDRLLAALYIAEYGDAVSCRAVCNACDKPFQFRFDLSALLASQDEDAAAVGPPGEDGCWAGPSGARLRPPTLADAAAGAGGLIARIVPTAHRAREAEVASFLERASPLLSLDLDAPCPECGAAQSIWFDLSRFLAESLAGERPFLIREAHLLAARYGWSHAEIMALPRADRRAYAALIESERSATLRRAS